MLNPNRLCGCSLARKKTVSPRKRRTREHVIADLSVNHVERQALLCGYAIERWFHELLYSSEIRPHPVVRFGALGERSGAVGAALLHDQRAHG